MTMLNAEEMKALIVCRLTALSDSRIANRDLVWAGIRALCFALTRADIGSLRAHDDASGVLDACEIPWAHYTDEHSEGTEVDEEWLEGHGFVEIPTGSGKWQHPRFDNWGSGHGVRVKTSCSS